MVTWHDVEKANIRLTTHGPLTKEMIEQQIAICQRHEQVMQGWLSTTYVDYCVGSTVKKKGSVEAKHHMELLMPFFEELGIENQIIHKINTHETSKTH